MKAAQKDPNGKPCKNCGSTERYIFPNSNQRPCVPCTRKAAKSWRDNNSNKIAAYIKTEKYRTRHLESRYNVTPEQFKSRLTKQKNKCAICKNKLAAQGKERHLDHDHVTKHFRGILCHNCNKGLGHFKDNIRILRAAINYLLRAKQK